MTIKMKKNNRKVREEKQRAIEIEEQRKKTQEEEMESEEEEDIGSEEEHEDVDNEEDDIDEEEDDNLDDEEEEDVEEQSADEEEEEVDEENEGQDADEAEVEEVEAREEKNSGNEEEDGTSLPSSSILKSKHRAGIIYLSYIPRGLTVAKTREILSAFGNVGRIYFEPERKLDKKRRPTHRFIEGWVEFEKKKVAKRVAEVLNAKPVGGKRRAEYHDALWSIKYLHRFKWAHLSERLAYEKAVKDQRLRTEIAQAKREANYYAKALERSIRNRKKRKLEGENEDDDTKKYQTNVKLKKTDKEIRSEKKKDKNVDKDLLMNIFAK